MTTFINGSRTGRSHPFSAQPHRGCAFGSICSTLSTILSMSLLLGRQAACWPAEILSLRGVVEPVSSAWLWALCFRVNRAPTLGPSPDRLSVVGVDRGLEFCSPAALRFADLLALRGPDRHRDRPPRSPSLRSVVFPVRPRPMARTCPRCLAPAYPVAATIGWRADRGGPFRAMAGARPLAIGGAIRWRLLWSPGVGFPRSPLDFLITRRPPYASARLNALLAGMAPLR